MARARLLVQILWCRSCPQLFPVWMPCQSPHFSNTANTGGGLDCARLLVQILRCRFWPLLVPASMPCQPRTSAVL